MNNNKPKVLIVGRSGSGKDTVAMHYVQKYGLKQLCSTTTRPRRSPTENTHVFVTEEEAATMTDRVAETVINGYQYFATRGQYEACDIYVIDPHGIEYLVKMSDEPIAIIYVDQPFETRLEHAKSRGNAEVEAKVFIARHDSENQQFTEFEDMIKSAPKEEFASKYHTEQVFYVSNTGTLGELYNTVDNIYESL